MTLNISPAGINLIKAFESCLRPIGQGKFKAYLDPVGVLTIGWGTTNEVGHKFDADTIWSQAQCDAALQADMGHFESAVRRLVKVQLNQNQFDALVSFTYNVGEGNLAKSGLLRLVNKGDFAGAAREFAKWDKAGGRALKGLTRRRASEALLFQGIPDLNYDGRPDKAVKAPTVEQAKTIQPMPQHVDAPEAKPMTQSKTLWSVAGGVVTTIAGTVLQSVSDNPVTVAVICGAILIGLFAFIGRERIQKLFDEGA